MLPGTAVNAGDPVVGIVVKVEGRAVTLNQVQIAIGIVVVILISRADDDIPVDTSACSDTCPGQSGLPCWCALTRGIVGLESARLEDLGVRCDSCIAQLNLPV